MDLFGFKIHRVLSLMMMLWWFLKRKSLEFYHVWVTRGILPFVGLHSQFPWCILIYHVHRRYTDYWVYGWNYCLLGCTEGGGSKSVSYWATLMTSNDNQVWYIHVFCILRCNWYVALSGIIEIDMLCTIWDVGSSRFQFPTDDGEEEQSSSKPRSRMGNERRVNMIKVMIHRERKLDPAYVKLVL